jgi:hypothetical protein
MCVDETYELPDVTQSSRPPPEIKQGKTPRLGKLSLGTASGSRRTAVSASCPERQHFGRSSTSDVHFTDASLMNMTDLLAQIDDWGPEKLIVVSDRRSGMKGVLVIDNTARGIARAAHG